MLCWLTDSFLSLFLCLHLFPIWKCELLNSYMWIVSSTYLLTSMSLLILTFFCVFWPRADCICVMCGFYFNTRRWPSTCVVVGFRRVDLFSCIILSWNCRRLFFVSEQRTPLARVDKVLTQLEKNCRNFLRQGNWFKSKSKLIQTPLPGLHSSHINLNLHHISQLSTAAPSFCLFTAEIFSSC